ncbi:hypothetical protein ACFE04_019157 [Oxalis oulophora]
MGAEVSKQVQRRKDVKAQRKILIDLDKTHEKLCVNEIVWPGTHNSATNKIGVPLVSRPFAQCQKLSIYKQLVRGTRVLDVRIQETRLVCHGPLKTYNVDVVLDDIQNFLSETQGEIIILEIRTEFGHKDPPEFDKYLEEKLGEFLIHQDDRVFGKTIAELLPKRIICVWKPRKFPPPKPGSPLWNAGYLRDNWIDTDLPCTKFESNLKYLSDQPPCQSRKYFYRVENTVTPQADNPVVCVQFVTDRIHRYAKLFISECFSKEIVNRLQIYSTDFIDEDFVDACVGITHARIEGQA